ncbi:twin-arginine translocation pathway signal, partial [Salmonella enterica subsp. enterica serovar Bareilly str. CFSAN001104]|nr:twin-arginine translocation pathway signal [Salmonella enterica subsp. enterica serovar Bareilly]
MKSFMKKNSPIDITSNDSELVWPILDPIADVKALISWGLTEIPVIGRLLSMLLGLLWPRTDEDIWNEIVKGVEKLINEELDAAVYSEIKSHLPGLQEVITIFLKTVKAGDVSVISAQFIACNTVFTATSSIFQNPDYEWILVPLFGVFAQLHISLLRESVEHGKEWGWSEKLYQEYITITKTTIANYVNYLERASENYKSTLINYAPNSPGQHMTDIFNYWNKYETLKTLYIKDVQEILKHMDPVIYKLPLHFIDFDFDDVFTPALGTADDFDLTCQSMAEWTKVVYSKPLSTMSKIYVEYFDGLPRILDISYEDKMGPRMWNNKNKRVNVVNIIADRENGVEKQIVKLPKKNQKENFPLISADVKIGSIPTLINLNASNGEKFAICRRDVGTQKLQTYSVKGRRLTTLNMWTLSHFYSDVLGCVIFGFSFEVS